MVRDEGIHTRIVELRRDVVAPRLLMHESPARVARDLNPRIDRGYIARRNGVTEEARSCYRGAGCMNVQCGGSSAFATELLLKIRDIRLVHPDPLLVSFQVRTNGNMRV